MKLTIERKDFLRALSHVHSVVEKRTTIPILSNLLLRAHGGKLDVTATDLDLEATDTASAVIDTDGQTTIPALTLFEIVRKLPDGAEIRVETDGDTGRVNLGSARSHFALPSLPAEDFQTMERQDAPIRFSMTTSSLKRLIDKTRFAISTEETRYYLNGIYLHHHADGENPTLRAVATDGHRLALAEMVPPEGSEALSGVIIPRKTVAELARLLENDDTNVDVEANETSITFRIGDAVLTSKLIEGSFPDYMRVIPTGNEKMLSVNAQEFSTAVDRVATVSFERARSVKLAMEAEKLVISVSHSESGEGDEEIGAEFSSEPLEIGFNARYLLDVAQKIEGDDVHFLFHDPISPSLISDPGDPAAQYVLMPLRV